MAHTVAEIDDCLLLGPFVFDVLKEGSGVRPDEARGRLEKTISKRRRGSQKVASSQASGERRRKTKAKRG